MKPVHMIAPAILMAAALGAASVSAQEPLAEKQQKLREMLTKADANKDGKITREEVTTHRAAMFAKMDRNADGTIDDQDRPRMLGRRKFDDAFEQVSTIFDNDGNGRVTKEEWSPPGLDIFGMLDRNGDNVLDQSELPPPPSE